MNVPKTSDYKLISAARPLANDALTTGVIDLNLLPAVLYELADRLAEITQPQLIAFCIALWNWHFVQVDEKGKHKEYQFLNPIYVRKKTQGIELGQWKQCPDAGVPLAFSEKTGIWDNPSLKAIDSIVSSTYFYQGLDEARRKIKKLLAMDDDAKRWLDFALSCR